MRRVVIDITDWNRFLYSNNSISGVHRIALGILRSWEEAGLPFEIIRHDPKTNRHKVISKEFLEEDFSEPIFIGGNPIRYTYNRYIQRRTKYYTELAKANIRRRLMKKKSESSGDFLLADYAPRPDDTLFFCGAGWDAPETMFAAKKWKLLYPGFRFVILVHDFIPLLKRVYKNKLGTRQFRRWFREAATVADQFISISENTKKDFIRLWPRLGRGPLPPCHVVTNPHEFLSIDNAQKAKSLGFDMLGRQRRRYILTVGSLSSHKNLERLLASWRAINFFSDPKADLVIVGNNNQTEVENLVSSRRRNVILFQKPTDAVLGLLYQNAHCSIFPSLYEGWGLPVGESLWFGTVCLSSSSSSIKEVGGDMCPYFNPYSTGEIISALTNSLFEPNYLEFYRSRIDRSKLKSWRSYGSEIHARLAAVD